MPNDEECVIDKMNQIFERNKRDLQDLNEISRIINSEFYMEPCLDDNGDFNRHVINSNKSDGFVTPQRNLFCDSSLATHTHPKNVSKGFLGISEPSPPDISFGVEKLLDPNDSLAVFCTQGLEDDRVKCLINPRKLDCSDKDDIIEFESDL